MRRARIVLCSCCEIVIYAWQAVLFAPGHSPAGEPGMCVNAASEARGASPLYTPRGVCFK